MISVSNSDANLLNIGWVTFLQILFIDKIVLRIVIFCLSFLFEEKKKGIVSSLFFFKEVSEVTTQSSL